MREAMASTQPPAAALIDHEALARHVERLAENPRVWVGNAGFSHEGRGIPYVVVAAPEAIERMEYHRRTARDALVPKVQHKTLLDVRVTGASTASELDKVPVLFVGASFGNEAAHVEALVQVADRLATSDEPAIQEILGRIIAIFIPLINPDGREAAIAEWRQYPNSAALCGSVNAWGQMLNRDFLWLTQPETRAVLGVYREWHPVAAYDPHEDMYMLGVSRPHVCWTPPFAPPVHPELHPAVVEAISAMGHAIAESWRQRGFNMLYDAHGNHDFMTLFRLGGRFHLSMALHGTPALITESARTPGTQTWEDRIDQKASAALAILELVARAPRLFVAAARASRQVDPVPDAFILSHRDNTPGSLRLLLETLLLHEVLVYETTDPMPGYVIPCNQPEARVVRSLLESAGWNLVALPPAMGVKAARVSDMADSDREVFLRSPLTPVSRATPPSKIVAPSAKADEVHVAIPNTPEGIRTLNRIWRGGARVRRLTRTARTAPSGVTRGAFVVSMSPTMLLPPDGGGSTVLVELPHPPGTHEAIDVPRPRIGLYVGQGVNDRYLPSLGDARWALWEMGFPWVELREDDFALATLQRCDVLIVPGGDPSEIVHGWSGQVSWQRAPWELPGSARGIGRAGVDAVRRFVEDGGGYIGIGLGGAMLAGVEHAGLLSIALVDHSLGEALVNLRIEKPEHPLVFGVSPDSRGAGASLIPAYYHSEPSAGILGGPVFAAADAADVIAVFGGPRDQTGTHKLRRTDLLEDGRKTPAILNAGVGRGTVTVFSFNPTFRCRWLSTAILLSNAIFAAVAKDIES